MRETVAYKGTTMKRVFTSGERAVVTEIPFANFMPGDIVAYFPNGPENDCVIRRIITRKFDFLIACGDSESMPDRHPITTKDNPLLVSAKLDFHGKKHYLTRGVKGMREFHHHRRLSGFIKCLSLVFFPVSILFFWRIKVRPTQFGQSIHYYHKTKLIAKATENGIKFKHWYYKLFYKICP